MNRVLTLILILLILVTAVSCGSGGERRTEFRYQSGSADYTSRMYYDDSLFDGPSDVYDPSLATASLSFAMASFASMQAPYEDRSRNARTLLESLGFTDVGTNEYYKEKPGTDSLGCVFGRKEIGGKPLIACGIRGANYESEWASNFTIGTETEGNYHQGFYEGSGIFLDSLRDYLAGLNIRGGIRLWIVGYSRAGAVGNISAGRIDEAIRDGAELLGEGITVEKTDLYAYFFEPPQGVYYDENAYPKSEIFSNIFNIVNHNDVVPMVAMKEFSFTRFGIDKYLFDSLSDIRYAEDIEKVADLFGDYENAEKLGSFALSSFEMKALGGRSLTQSTAYCHWAQGIFLEDFVTHLTRYGIRTKENYESEIQAGLRDIFRFIYSRDEVSGSLVDLGLSVARSALVTDSLDLLIEDVLHNQSKLVVDFRIVLLRALEELNVDVDADTVTQAVESLLKAVVSALIQDFEFSMILPLFSKANLHAVAQAHQPELTLAYLRALDPHYTEDPVECEMDGTYYYIEIGDLTADVSVRCGEKEIVRFEGGVPVETGSSVPYGRHRALRVYLPYHTEEGYEVLSSCDRILIRRYEPSKLSFDEPDLPAAWEGDAYRTVIPAA